MPAPLYSLQIRSTMSRLLPSVMVGFLVGCGETAKESTPAPVPVEILKGERVENPSYRNWVGFPVGTRVVRRSITEEIGRPEKTTTISTFTLVEKTDEHITLELKTHTTRYDGLVLDNPSDRFSTDRYFHLPPGQSPGKSVTGVEQDEPITISARTHRVRLVESRDRNEGGEVFVKTWTSDTMPGGLVKSITETPNVKKRTTIETTDVTIPK